MIKNVPTKFVILYDNYYRYYIDYNLYYIYYNIYIHWNIVNYFDFMV